jgi:thermitase
MLSLLYPISYLLCLAGLALWYYFKENRSVSRMMSTLFLFSLLTYTFSLVFTDGSLSYKFLILFRDMLIMTIVSQLFNFIRKSPLVVLLASIAFYVLIQFAGFNMLYNSFPEVQKSATTVNDDYELLVETKDGQIPGSYLHLMDKYGLTSERAFHPEDPSLSSLDEFVLIGIPDQSENKTEEIIRELRRLHATSFVEYNEVINLEVLESEKVVAQVSPKNVNDPMATNQWGWDIIQGDHLHEVLSSSSIKPKKQALIAILDSGIDAKHEDLVNQFHSSGAANDTDPLGHGTHCAGIAAAVSNNGLGITSLIPNASFVQVTSIKVMNAMGIGNQQAAIDGMIKAADMGADVVSMSLGGISSDSRQKAYEEAVKYCNAKGTIVVASAGNSNQNAKGYAPANAKGIITVSAIGSDQKKASFSNTVDGMSYGIAAPGVKILSTYPNQQYKELDGTSMAAPMVAGLVGMLKAFRPDITTNEVYEILSETGKTIPDGKRTGKMIQAANALERVLD